MDIKTATKIALNTNSVIVRLKDLENANIISPPIGKEYFEAYDSKGELKGIWTPRREDIIADDWVPIQRSALPINEIVVIPRNEKPQTKDTKTTRLKGRWKHRQ